MAAGRGTELGDVLFKAILRVVTCVVAAVISIALFGSGVASADALTGKTYSDAQAWDSKKERDGDY